VSCPRALLPGIRRTPGFKGPLLLLVIAAGAGDFSRFTGRR
jgi:hypothetical protein